MKSRISGILAVALMTASVAVNAGLILQDTGNVLLQVEAFEPLGQSFTAEDPYVSFAFSYFPMNPGQPNDDSLQLRLLSGDGLGGTELGSFTFALPSDFNGFFDVDLSSILLTVGQIYTAELSVLGDSHFWGAHLNARGNPYPGGRAYFTPLPFDLTPDPSDDFTFRVTPISSVPEPATLALLGIALTALGFIRRKQFRLLR